MRTIAVIVTYNRIELLKECLGKVDAQEIPFSRIIVVDNASTDGTREYLDSIADPRYVILHAKVNEGGAGGFYRGMEKAMEEPFDWILLIDDDAMIRPDYMRILLEKAPDFSGAPALAGRVVTDHRTDVSHRRRVTNRLIFSETPVEEKEYERENFYCDTATFCGLLLRGDVVRRAGLPKKEYFIWCDDTEYCLRIIDKEHRVTVIPQAVLDHKTVLSTDKGSLLMRIETKSYYGYRNRYDAAKLHIGGLTPLMIRLEYRIFYILSFWISRSSDPKVREQGQFNRRVLKAILEDTKSGRLGKREGFL
ncbi:MAG: glycosyltransferase [Lachnospiraceae bacterium]|nr:glycosyltransferase [Lachnospiraceae bacterium]